MENQIKSKYLWVVGLKVSGGNGDSLQNVGFAGITFGHEISITINGGKVLPYPDKFPATSKVKEEDARPLHVFPLFSHK